MCAREKELKRREEEREREGEQERERERVTESEFMLTVIVWVLLCEWVVGVHHWDVLLLDFPSVISVCLSHFPQH